MCRKGLSVSLLAEGILILLLLQGCGYHVAGRGKGFIGGIKTISIPLFTNEAKGGEKASLIYSELEQILTMTFADELTRTGVVEVVDKGEAELKGRIKTYRLVPSSYTSGDVVSEYRMEVTLDISIIKDGKEVWRGELTDSEEFVASDDPNTFKNNEEVALREVASELAKLLRERVVEDF